MENLERLTVAEMEDFVRSNRGVQIGTDAAANMNWWSGSYAPKDTVG
jgi:hypothetical protein